MRIMVTKQDIVRAQHDLASVRYYAEYATRCPVARAIARVLGRTVRISDPRTVTISRNDWTLESYVLPEVVGQHIRIFDSERWMEPFEFDLGLGREGS